MTPMPCPHTWPYCSNVCREWDYRPPTGDLSDVFIMRDDHPQLSAVCITPMETAALDVALSRLGLLAEESSFTRLPVHQRHAKTVTLVPVPVVHHVTAESAVSVVPRRKRAGAGKYGSHQRPQKPRPPRPSAARTVRAAVHHELGAAYADSDEDASANSDESDDGPTHTSTFGSFLTVSARQSLGLPTEELAGEPVPEGPWDAADPSADPADWPALPPGRSGAASSSAPARRRWVAEGECPVCGARVPQPQLARHVERCLSRA
eukprot:EG_transcript_24278